MIINQARDTAKVVLVISVTVYQVRSIDLNNLITHVLDSFIIAFASESAALQHQPIGSLNEIKLVIPQRSFLEKIADHYLIEKVIFAANQNNSP